MTVCAETIDEVQRLERYMAAASSDRDEGDMAATVVV